MSDQQGLAAGYHRGITDSGRSGTPVAVPLFEGLRKAAHAPGVPMKDSRRLKVMAAIPVVDGHWTQLPDERKRSHTGELIAATLDVIEGEGREPDNFEALDLKSAMAAMESCMYTAAVTFVQRALAPSRDRGSCTGFRSEFVATTRDLRAQLASLRSQAGRSDPVSTRNA